MKELKRVPLLTEDYHYSDKERPGYFLQINNQNCHYEIRVNDLLEEKYIDAYPTYSVRVPVNSEILKSGEQTLSIRVTPFQGNTLSKNADLQIRLMRYNDMTDEVNDYGGHTVLMEWEMPQVKEDFPDFKFDTVFTANVPYEIKELNNAVDLSKLNQKILLKEVVELFKLSKKILSNGYRSFQPYHNSRLNLNKIVMYQDNNRVQQAILDNIKDFDDTSEVWQPIENYKLTLYGNGKVVTLERLIDGGRIFWWTNGELEETSSFPLFFYKDKRDGEWYVW